MKNEAEIKDLYQDRLQKCFKLFVLEKAQEWPEHCRHNVRHQCDMRPGSATYNRIGAATVPIDDIIDITETTIIVGVGDKTVSILKSQVFDDLDNLNDMLHMPSFVAEKLGVPFNVETMGICGLTLQGGEGAESLVKATNPPPEIRLCDAHADAEGCPAFLSKFTRDSVEQDFWDSCVLQHPDLIVLKTILEATTTLSWWRRLKLWFTFKK